MTIVYVESNTTGFGQSLLAASSHYDDVAFMTRDPARYPFLKTLPQVRVIRCDTTSIEALTDAVQQLAPVRFVASTSDAAIEIVARVSEAIGTAGNNSTAVALCRDKLDLQETLRDHRVAYPKTVTVSAPGQVPGLPFPVIVKPRRGTGSIGVRLVESADRFPDLDGEFICQQFIGGHEFSVESFSDAGGHQILGITRKFVSKPPYFLELGHVFPAGLDAQTSERIDDTVRRALDAVGYTFGPAHTEVKLHDGEVTVIEINARLAGGMIPRLMEKSCAWSLPDLYIRSYLSAHSQFTVPPFQLTSAVMFVVPEKDRRYVGIDFPPGCDDAGLFRQHGVNAGKFDFSDRAGYVISVAGSELAALRKSVRHRAQAAVLYDDPPAPLAPLVDVNIGANTEADAIRDIVYNGRPLALNLLMDSILSIEKAHLLMLRRQSIIDSKSFASLRDAVLALEAEPALIEDHASGRGDYYDYEHYMIDRCGLDTGGMIQTARSRNDINSTHLLLVIRQVLHALARDTIGLSAALLTRAAQTDDVLLPVYSQFQTAMPGTAGHYLSAQSDILLGSLAALGELAEQMDTSPLGACAGAGTSFATDSQATAEWLGFAHGPINSLSAISNKNSALRCLYLIGEISGNINRIATDFQLLSMREIGILTLPDGMYGGSSNMPQKRNPYLLEWLRCGHERNVGRLLTAISAVSHLPSGNSYQASRQSLELVTEAADQIHEMLTVLTYAVNGAQFSATASEAAIVGGHACATLAAEALVQQRHASFRDAHTQIGAALRDEGQATGNASSAIRTRLQQADADLSEGRAIDALVGGGGPARANTRAAIAQLDTRLDEARRRLALGETRAARAKLILDRLFRSAC